MRKITAIKKRYGSFRALWGTNYILCGLLLILLVSCKKQIEKNSSDTVHPNIVFLFADDYTYEAVHAMGNPFVKTPNLDRMVQNGTSFTHAYNMGGWHGAVCVASRSMIISGRSVWEAQEQARKWEANDSIAVAQTWPLLMQASGYNTYMSGKWHITAPVQQLFDSIRNKRPGGMPYDKWALTPGVTKRIKERYLNGKDIQTEMPNGYFRPVNTNDTTWSAADTTKPGYWKGGKHWSEVLKDDAIEFIDIAAQKEDPFFMYLAFNAPHDPRQAPQSFLDLYSIDSIPVPENWLPEYPYKDSIGNSPWLRDEALAPYPRTPFVIKTHLKEYYAIITHLDAQIGKILDALEASGKMDNTYIFFTGDHGLSVGHHGLIGKQSLFDHSIRVPLLVMGPDIPKDKKVTSDVYLQDIMATSLELAHIDRPNYLDFNSFLALAQGKTEKGYYEAGVYGAYMDLQRMIRKNGYKLLVYPKLNKVLLFNMENDPLEMHDLSKEPEQKERVRQLFGDLLELQKEMKDSLDLSKVYQSI